MIYLNDFYFYYLFIFFLVVFEQCLSMNCALSNTLLFAVNLQQIDTVNMNQFIYIFHQLREKLKNLIFYVNMQMNHHIEFISTVTSAQHL